jgi:hypothetical protein
MNDNDDPTIDEREQLEIAEQIAAAAVSQAALHLPSVMSRCSVRSSNGWHILMAIELSVLARLRPTSLCCFQSC